MPLAQAILLDFDGVVVDTIEKANHEWRQLADRYALDSAELVRFSQGRRIAEVLAHFLSEDQRSDAENWIRDTIDLDRPAAALPGSLQFCRQLASFGVPWGIVTSGLKSSVRARMLSLGIPAPTVIISAEDVAKGKPDPMIYRMAISKLGVEDQMCVAVEDSDVGAQAALAAGIPAGNIIRLRARNDNQTERVSISSLKHLHIRVASPSQNNMRVEIYVD